MKKIILYASIFLINVSIAFAQTGLFSSEGATTFANTGIIIVLVIIIGKVFLTRLFKRRKK